MFDFLKLRKSVEDLGKQLKDVRAQIETTRQKIEAIIYAPAHPEDILSAASEWVQAKEREYHAYFAERIIPHFSAHPGSLNNPAAMQEELQFTKLSAGREEFVLVGLIGSQRILEIFKEHTANMAPGDYGMRNAERGPALEALQATLAKLQATEAQLVAGAASAGLEVQ